MWGEPQRLKPHARDILEDASTDVYVSAASAWEIATKAAAGRLRLPAPADEWLADPRHLEDVVEVPIRFPHAVRAATLPQHHRDPFDRMLVAQAQLEDLRLISADPKLAAYEVETIQG